MILKEFDGRQFMRKYIHIAFMALEKEYIGKACNLVMNNIDDKNFYLLKEDIDKFNSNIDKISKVYFDACMINIKSLIFQCLKLSFNITTSYYIISDYDKRYILNRLKPANIIAPTITSIFGGYGMHSLLFDCIVLIYIHETDTLLYNKHRFDLNSYKLSSDKLDDIITELSYYNNNKIQYLCKIDHNDIITV